ncbi:MAG: glycosyltransferase [Flavobacteriales bacterium]|nr:glycosyltransferase [Flavobacteriales bacterium]
MKVCQLTTVHGAFDDRIFFKECVALAEAGHEVVEIAPASEGTTTSGVRITPVRIPPSRFLRPLLGGWRAFHAVRALDPDVVHFHDPELIPVGLLLRRSGMRVVYDMRGAGASRDHGQDLARATLVPKAGGRSIHLDRTHGGKQVQCDRPRRITIRRGDARTASAVSGQVHARSQLPRALRDRPAHAAVPPSGQVHGDLRGWPQWAAWHQESHRRRGQGGRSLPVAAG